MGHAWMVWEVPSQPGSYRLLARLLERHSDTGSGNNIFHLDVFVAPRRREGDRSHRYSPVDTAPHLWAMHRP